MKNVFRISLFLLCFLPWRAVAQQSKTIHLDFSEQDFFFESLNDELHISTSKYHYGVIPDEGSLSLPIIYVSVLVSPDFEYVGINYDSKKELIRKDVDISKTSLPHLTGMSGNNFETKNPNTKYSFSDSMVVFTGIHTMGIYKFVSFAICPFRYEGQTRCLYLNSSIDLYLYSKAGHTRNDIRRLKSGQNMRDVVRKMVVNGVEMESLYGQFEANTEDIQGVLSSPRSYSDYDYEYLIITNNVMKDSFQQLADWKTRKGVRTKVLTVEKIDSSYTGTYQQLRIKQAIKDYYDNSSCGLQYVLLGGDESVIPPHLAHVDVYARDILLGYIYCVEDAPADLFYGCLNTMEWSGDDYYGVYGSVDKTPEVFLTRVPVNSSSDAGAFAGRVIRYEQSFDENNWNGKILLSGKKLSGTFNVNGNFMSDAHYHSEKMYNEYIMDNWGGQKISFFDTGTDLNNGNNYDFNSQHLQAELSNEYPFVDINTHGDFDRWATQGNPYTVNNAFSLNAPDNYTIITTEACHTNAFDSLICLSESFFRNHNSGIIGYFGCSRYGIYNLSTELGPSCKLNGNFYKYLFTEDKKNYGYITTLAKNTLVPLSYLHVADTWLLWLVNPLGDPEMPIYTSCPQQFNGIEMSFQNDSLIINTGTDSCRVCLMSLSDNGATYYEVQDIVSRASFYPPADSCSICITKTGYVPYMSTYHDTVYVQNETLSGTNHIVARNIRIGRDVDMSKPQGPVKIASGNTSVSGSNTLIKNNFEVESGATFSIGK